MRRIVEINPKYYLFSLGIIFLFLGAVSVLSWNDNLHFGEGMVDIFYCIGTGVFALALMVYVLDNIYFRNVGRLETKHYLILGFYVLISLLTLLKITFLRGPMSPWNGQVFF